MNEILEFISQPWHWAVSGVMIASLMFLMLYGGERFGVSSSFETICSMSGAGKRVKLFNTNWRVQSWLLIFLVGAMIGGFIATTLLQSPEPVQVSEKTVSRLASMGVDAPGEKSDGLGFLPGEIFNFENLLTLKGFIFMVLGGFFIGFGTRWARGCTSGHAISGLSNLQLPSLVAVIGFFLGGLLMSHFLMPIILSL